MPSDEIISIDGNFVKKRNSNTLNDLPERQDSLSGLKEPKKHAAPSTRSIEFHPTAEPTSADLAIIILLNQLRTSI